MNDIFSTGRQPMRSASLLPPHPFGWLRGEIDRLFDDFGSSGPPRGIINLPSIDTMRPVADMKDEGGSYRLAMELPGIKQDAINIEYHDGVLTVSGEKKEETESKREGCILSERRFGSFRRQLALPSDVDAEGISATFSDGVLTLTLKKSEDVSTKPKKIAIGA
ncbi:Hsp20/alpha crystallin family protein [Novosphingobium sp. G106]|uniref:Hsp20/alpha crystallin family protein n=1 Tax=Novosphingobium sp. G106 TaxID=2849500 RepID=UPI0020C31933|nr:Hsp20/alpha crystallin family protein [Novosphingobium sp. G106]